MPTHGYDSDRLVDSPVFLMSLGRSGSTLLRCILDSHSRIIAGPEMHLYGLKVTFDTEPTVSSMRELGVMEAELENMMWDRILYAQVRRSGKDIVVDKTPGNVQYWERISEYWPNARYIFLFRNPVSILDSVDEIMLDTSGYFNRSRWVELITNFSRIFSAAADKLHGIKVRYEDLTATPELVTKSICSYLDVPWEEKMLRYGTSEHGRFEVLLGDWKEKIRSGEVQEPRQVPAANEIPSDLREAAILCGYL